MTTLANSNQGSLPLFAPSRGSNSTNNAAAPKTNAENLASLLFGPSDDAIDLDLLAEYLLDDNANSAQGLWTSTAPNSFSIR